MPIIETGTPAAPPPGMGCARPLNCSDVYGELVIDGWSLHTGAWCAWDLSPLFESPLAKGENIDVPQIDGRVPRAWRDDETTVTLPMMFSGAVTMAGLAWDDPAGGLLRNLRDAEGRWVRPIRTGTPTLAATLTVPEPDGTDLVLSAAVQPTGLAWQLLPNGYARAALTLTIPSGRFA